MICMRKIKKIVKNEKFIVMIILLAIYFLAVASVVQAATWTQTADPDFQNGQMVMVKVEDGSLKLAYGLNNQWQAVGEAEDDRFGYSVATAGDVNGDGFVDVIMGAYRNDDGGLDAGKVYLFLGSVAGLKATASWTAKGKSVGDYFGYSIATAGDVNGDGFDDVIVGAFGNDEGGLYAGKVYLFLGSASGLAATASWTATGEAAYDYFGYSVSTAGDVNSDGFDDIIVGAKNNDEGGLNAGKAYLFLGSTAGLEAKSSWTATGEAVNDFFGCSVSTAGDVNSDGFDDVIVGAIYNDEGGANAGSVYLFLGSSAGLETIQPPMVKGEAAGDYFGDSVATAGDVNGDGFDDVIVGAYYNDEAESNAGKVYLFLGSAAGLEATAFWTATGEAADDNFGRSVATAGDVNDDGFDDVIVGAPYNDDVGSNTGKVYLFLGSAVGLEAAPSWAATGEATDDYFGSNVATVGDVNGDDFDGIMVNAYCNDEGGINAGKVYLYQIMDNPLHAFSRWTAAGEAANDYFGDSVANAGDVNGDGFDDVIVGAKNNDEGGSKAGKAYLFLGSTTGLDATASWAAAGEAEYDVFGSSVATAGDVNGDGFDDVIVGAYYNDEGGGNAGKAYLFLGSAAGLAAVPSWTATGEAAGDFFGNSVATAGDVNGDGFDDVIVGAYFNDEGGALAGKAYLFLGSATGLATVPSWTKIGEAASDLFGRVVATAGDVNNDGFDDVIVGADGNDDGGSFTGKAYLFLGSASGLAAIASWTATGEAGGDTFGKNVATAGDVNGDGFDDVIVSALYNDEGGTKAGKAYLFLGSAAGLTSTASWAATGEAAEDRFGSSVATAGDVNSDGFDDVMVGAYWNDEGGSYAGKAYLFLGSAAGLAAVPSWTATGEAVDDFFGCSVSTAGDVNSDGFDDFMVGAYWNDEGGTYAGKAYLYASSGYCEHGVFLSDIFSTDSANLAKWQSMIWDPPTQPEGAELTFQIGASNDAINWTFLGPDGTPETYYTNPLGEIINPDQHGVYWRFKAILSGNGKKTPSLTSVSIFYQEYDSGPTVTLNSPNGWEVLIGGREATVTWDATGNFGATPVSLFYSLDQGQTWITIQQYLANTGLYTWAVPPVESEEALVKVRVLDVLNLVDSDLSDENFFIGLEKERISLFPGWNFVSTPAKLGNSSDEVQQVFSGVDMRGNPVYLYDNGSWNQMAGNDLVITLDGIWIYSASSYEVTLSFDTNPLAIPPIKNLEAYWNAIGHSAKVPLPADSLLSSVESLWTYCIGFDASGQSYKPCIINNDEHSGSSDQDRPLYPTEGYWLYMTGPGVLGGVSMGQSLQGDLLLSGSTVQQSSGVPQLPEAYYGTVFINTTPAPIGTQITAKINGIQKGTITATEEGTYGGPSAFDPKIVVPGNEYEVGETVTFWVNGIESAQTDIFHPGTNTNLNLTIEVCYGDFDLDKDVDGSDLAAFSANFGRTDCGSGLPCDGDFDNDSDVDNDDLTVFTSNFGRTDCP